MAPAATVGRANADFEFMKQILEKLFLKGDAKWGRPASLGQAMLDSLEHVGTPRQRMRRAEYYDMVSKFRDNRVKFRTDKFFYLPPLTINSEFVPILYGSCDFAGGSVNLQVELHCDAKNGSETHSVSFRFENPGNSPPHDYWHSQVTPRSHLAAVPIPGCPAWLPDSVPAFPLTARDPLELFFALLVSLYGYPFVSGLLRDANAARIHYERLGKVVQRGLESP